MLADQNSELWLPFQVHWAADFHVKNLQVIVFLLGMAENFQHDSSTT